MSDRTASIILLSGASSAGKSTLCRELQTQLEAPFLHFSPDVFLFGGQLLPARREPDGPFAWATMRPGLFEGHFGCLAALAGAGNNLLVDFIVETWAQLQRLVDLLAPFEVFFVGVHCPPDELERRERRRGDRRSGDARRDLTSVHRFGAYDLEVDSSGPPPQTAGRIIAAWRARSGPGVFWEMAAAGLP